MREDDTSPMDTADMYFLPTIDSEALTAAIERYRGAHPQQSLGDDSSTHIMLADFLPFFLDRVLWHFPYPMVELYWPEMFWTGLAQGHGLFGDDAPKLKMKKSTDSEGIILFQDEEIGRFAIMSGEEALAMAERRAIPD